MPRSCCICGTEVPPSRSKRAATCSPECQKTRILRYSRSYYKANPDAWRLSHVARRYGLSAEEYARLVDTAGDRCAICREPQQGKSLAVDHHHDTGVVRGLLCQNCNIMIGMARENPEILRQGAEYLISTAERYTRENPIC